MAGGRVKLTGPALRVRQRLAAEYEQQPQGQQQSNGELARVGCRIGDVHTDRARVVYGGVCSYPPYLLPIPVPQYILHYQRGLNATSPTD